MSDGKFAQWDRVEQELERLTTIVENAVELIALLTRRVAAIEETLDCWRETIGR